MADLKEDLKSIFLTTLESIDIEARLRERIRVEGNRLSIGSEDFVLSKDDGVLLIGFGKASLEMGRVVESVLGNWVKRGILVSNQKNRMSFKSEIIVSGHPTPNENSIAAAKRILELIRESSVRTLIIFLVSGGGSSLVELPLGNLTLAELQLLNQTLVTSGASIHEINLVRKHLSQIKGGKLAHFVNGRRSAAIYLSDVNPGDIGSIASGPLYKASEDLVDVLEVLNKYSLLERLPGSIGVLLESLSPSNEDSDSDTDDPEITHHLLLDNENAVRIASAIARKKGYRVEVVDDQIEGEYRVIADVLIDRLLSLQARFPNEAVCMISGGEVGCAVKGRGIGGRNQEFVLYSATKLYNSQSDVIAAVLSCGTDGIDGNSVAGGAVIDSQTISIACDLGMNAEEYLRQNDSHSFLKQLGGLILLGPSGNNVRDIRIMSAATKSI